MFNYQKTIQNQVSCHGVGLHSGSGVNLTLKPGAEDSGIVFKRTDVSEHKSLILADYRNVAKTVLGTTLSNEHGIEVATIEHLMAALWGCGINNCLVEINAAEVPIMDGSSEPFVFLIECAGKKIQKRTRKVIEILKEVKIEDKKGSEHGFISIKPAEAFSVDLEIDFGDEVISCQKGNFDSRGVSFKNEVSRARTFGFEHEVDYLRQNGLARGGSLDNAIVVGEKGILNEESLRYSDEFVRHKILDCIGDVYLSGAYIKGQFDGYKSGHCLNNLLLHSLFADEEAWRVVQLPNNEPASMLQYKVQ